MLLRFAYLAAVALALSGCLYQEFSTPPNPTPGGAIVVMMSSGAQHTTAALGHDTAEPLDVEGATPLLTFSLIAGDDLAGGTARNDLAQPNSYVELQLTTSTRTKLEVHADGSGCVATSGTVHLHTDDKMKLGGDFTATGTISGSGAPCTLGGTLDGVPLLR